MPATGSRGARRLPSRSAPLFRDDEYWARPVPGFGDPKASVLVVGLAPAAHGANRTGRMFTGDRAVDWLYRAMHKAWFANQALSRDREDGLSLTGAYVTAGVRCAPPRNRPTTTERNRCADFLRRETDILWDGLHTIVPLGGFAFTVVLGMLAERGLTVPRPRPRTSSGGHCPAKGGQRFGSGAGFMTGGLPTQGGAH